jgi:hypothetical protein
VPSAFLERIETTILSKISLPVRYLLASLLTTPLVGFVNDSNPYLLLDGYFDSGLTVASNILGTWFCLLAVRAADSNPPLQIGLKIWLFVCWCTLLCNTALCLVGNPEEVELDRKGQMVLTEQTMKATPSAFLPGLGLSVTILNYRRVLVPRSIAERGVTICITDLYNQAKLGHCYLESAKLAHVEIGGKSFTVDLTESRNIMLDELLSGGAR